MTESMKQARVVRGWPAAVGVVFATAMIVLLWLGRADAGTAAEILTAAAFVYLGSAALGRPAAAWPLFGVTFVVIGIRFAIPSFPAFPILLILAGALAVYGFVRGRARPLWGLPTQLVAMGVVVTATLGGYALGAPWLGVVAGVGLVAHALWDVRHLRARRVVAPSMAEFCAALDLVLAVGVIIVSLR